MLDPKTNSNRRQSSTFMETLQDKLKDIKNFSNWSAKEQMVAVTAVGVIFGALFPVVAVALPVAAAGAAVALTLFFAVKAVEYGYKGLKWSAEKTWEGARYTAGKIKAGAVYAKDSVKKGYENSVDSLKRGSGKVKSAIGSALKTVGHKISSTGEDMNISYKLTDFTDTGVLLLTEDGKKEYNSIRNTLRNISDKHLLEKISSEMVSLIDSKIESEKNMIDFQNKGNLHKSEALISRWIKQKNSIVELDPKGLQKRLSYEGYDRDLYQIFSEHHNEIRKVISQCKREYEFDQSVKRNNAKDKEKKEAGKSSSFPSLGRKSPTKSEGGETKEPPKEPFSSDLGVSDKNDEFYTSLSSGSSAPTERQNLIDRVFSSTDVKGLPEPLTPKKFATIGRKPSGKQPIPVAPPKVTGGRGTSLEKEWKNFVEGRVEEHKRSTLRSNSSDSGIDSSGPSTPTGRQSPSLKEKFDKELAEKLEKRRSSVDQLSVEPVNLRVEVPGAGN